MDFSDYATASHEAQQSDYGHGTSPHERELEIYNLTYRKHQFLYLATDRLSRSYELIKGYIKLSQYSDSGRETIFSLLKPGDMLGNLTPDTVEANEYAQALTKVELKVFESDVLKQAIYNKPEFILKILTAQHKRNHHLQLRMSSIAFLDVRLRILTFMKFLGIEYGKIRDGVAFMDNFLTHQDIALINQTSRQSVTMVLSKLKMKGVIFYDRYQLIIYLDKLEQAMSSYLSD
ncbi:MAG: Crp/Fnr family transcriptional regulator [Bacteroidota bacterium]